MNVVDYNNAKDIAKAINRYIKIKDWVASTAYIVGQYVNNDGVLYKCTTANNDATFNPTNWQKITGGGLDEWEPSTLYSVDDVVIYNNKIYQCNTAHTSGATFLPDEAKWTEISACITRIPNWVANEDYVVGDLVAHDAKIYRCTTAHTSGSTFDSTEEAKWEELSPTINEISLWAAATDYEVGQLVIYNNKLFRCTAAHTSTSSFISDINNWQEISSNDLDSWQPSMPYRVGDFVYKDGQIYRCTTAHTSDSSNFYTDITNWELLDTKWRAENWAASKYYAIGDVVLYDNRLFKCITANTSSSDFVTDYDKWSAISSKLELWKTNTYYAVGDIVIYNNKLYRCKTGHTSTTTLSADIANWDLISSGTIDNWKSNEDYNVNSVVIYNNKIYQCKTSHSAGSTFDYSKWKEISSSDIDLWAANFDYIVGDIVIYDNQLYRCNTAHTSTSAFKDTIADWDILYSSIKQWNTNTAYKLDEDVIYNNRLYKCITAHTSTSSFDDDKDNWQLIYGYDIKHEVEGSDIEQGMNVKVTEDGELIANDLLKHIRAANINDELSCLGEKELTNSEIFSSWKVFTCNRSGGHWNDLSNSDQAAAKNSYSFNVDNDAIICNRNNDSFSAFISQEEYRPDFTVEYTIDNRILASVIPGFLVDDDGIFFILGFMKDSDGNYHTLSVIRNGSTNGTHGTRFAIAYDLFTSFLSQAGSTMKLLATTNSLTGHNWTATSYANLKVEKSSTTITASTSQIGSDPYVVTLTYTLPATKPSDMTQDQYDNIKYMMENDSKIGFGTQSNESAFKLSIPTGSVNAIDVYNVKDITKAKYEDGVKISESPDTTTILPQEFIYSEANKRLFYVKSKDSVIEIKLNSLCEPWAEDTFYVEDAIVEYEGNVYRCNTAHISDSNPPANATLYKATTGTIYVDDTTTIPYSETIDLGSVKKVTDFTYNEVTTDMSFTYTIETSEDNITFTPWDGTKTDARYVKLTVDTVSIVTGATSPSAYLDDFTVIGESDNWEKLSSSSDIDYATDSDIDNLFN